MRNGSLRILPHIVFWGSFTSLFLLQNPEAGIRDYLSWFEVLGVTGVVVYVNLYVLFPRYLFEKRYLIYSFHLIWLISIGAAYLKFRYPSGDTFFSISFIQHAINLFVFVVITSSLNISREYFRKQGQLAKLEKEQLKTEISLLKSQVNPHFLFNTLNNLYGLITQHENQKASDVTLRLSDLMRYILESSKTEKVRLHTEIKFLDDYLALERIRLNDHADIRLDVSGIDKDVFVAPLLFIPLVENAFKHGLQTISDIHYAHFSLSVQGNDLFFEAKNSVGRHPNKPTESGTGLDNLRKRLQLMYSDNHQLDIEQTDTTFNVTLHVKL